MPRYSRRQRGGLFGLFESDPKDPNEKKPGVMSTITNMFSPSTPAPAPAPAPPIGGRRRRTRRRSRVRKRR